MFDELPERLLVGTGAYRQMRPDPGTLEALRARGSTSGRCRPHKRCGATPSSVRGDSGGAAPDLLTVALSRAEFERRVVQAHRLRGERCLVCPRGRACQMVCVREVPESLK